MNTYVQQITVTSQAQSYDITVTSITTLSSDKQKCYHVQTSEIQITLAQSGIQCKCAGE